MNQKTLLIAAVVLYIVSAVGSYAYFSGGLTGGSTYKPPVTATNEGGEDTAPKTEECPLNGALYSKAARENWEKRRPIGVMIENSLDSRPQSGLTQADVIYEAVAEGGITRFLVMYYCDDPEIVGPVRSARMYFIRLLQGYGNYPLYAHVGGANAPGPADALGEIRDLGWAGYNDVTQFNVDFPIYYRDETRLPGVAVEHTMYLNLPKLWKYSDDKRGLSNVDEDGESWDETFTPWKFQDDAKVADRGDVLKIDYFFWSQSKANYGVTWQYDAETNSYKRLNGGKAHTDKNTNKPITAKNVIVIEAEEIAVNDDCNCGHLLYDLEGSGPAYIFQNGTAIEGTWNKAEPEDRMVFEDEDGEEIEMVRGQVFVSIIPEGNVVTY